MKKLLILLFAIINVVSIDSFIIQKCNTFNTGRKIVLLHERSVILDVEKHLVQQASRESTNDDYSFIINGFKAKDSDDKAAITLTDSTSSEVRPFPFGMIIDKDEIKKALLLAAVNPSKMGGIVLSGGRGTGKSVLANAVHKLLPEYIERVKDSQYNIDPRGVDGIDSFLQSDLEAKGKRSLNDDDNIEIELVRTPFVQIPLNVQEDSLLGTVDLEKSMETGCTVFSPGLLAKAHRGILYVDEINLLEEEMANILLNVIMEGYVTVEREGLSVRYPCKPLLIATYNPAEGELREHLLDRIGVALSTDIPQLTLSERVAAVDNNVGFSAGTKEQLSKDVTIELRKAEDEETNLQEKILAARCILPNVKIQSSQILYLCEEATRADCEGQRAEIFATEVAKTSAALDLRMEVNADDLKLAVLLAIAPRANCLPGMTSDDEEILQQTAESPLQPITPDQPMDQQKEEQQQDEEDKDEETDDQEEKDEPESDEQFENEELEIPLEFMFGVEQTTIDPKLLYFSRWARKGKGGKRARIFNLQRGRFVKAIFPKGGEGKIAIGATLRAAAPHQKWRRARAEQKTGEGRMVYVNKDDFRIKRMARKSGSLIIFVVDASGSMALNRMDAAKGAALGLLSEAYKSRDKICLIAFHEDKADVVVPPTKSMALTKNRLEAMPCGGGSPLAHALTTAMRTGLNAIKVKQDVGRVIVVLLTDGRANIPMCTSMGERFDPIIDPDSVDGLPSKRFLKDEVLACAKTMSTLKDFNLLCIDTEDKFVGTGLAEEIATASLGSYYHIGSVDSGYVSSIAKKGVEAARVESLK